MWKKYWKITAHLNVYFWPHWPPLHGLQRPKIMKIEMREFNFWCAAIAQNFLLFFSLVKISRKLHEKHSIWKEKRKSVSLNGIYNHSLYCYDWKLGHWIHINPLFWLKHFSTLILCLNARQGRNIRMSYICAFIKRITLHINNAVLWLQ